MTCKGSRKRAYPDVPNTDLVGNMHRGLGKTVQTISLIHLNQAKEGDDEKATLVLAPQGK